MPYSPTNKTRIWFCSQCHWSHNAGKSDAVVQAFEKCPKCNSELELTFRNTHHQKLIDIGHKITAWIKYT